MKPDYDVEIDHYYFTFAWSDNGWYEDIEVSDEDEFISLLKNYYDKTDNEICFSRTDYFDQEYDENDDVIDEDYDTEELACINVEDGTVEFYEQNDFDRETLKNGFEHLEEKINKFLTDFKQARADREKQQGQEFSLEQKQSKGRCR